MVTFARCSLRPRVYVDFLAFASKLFWERRLLPKMGPAQRRSFEQLSFVFTGVLVLAFCSLQASKPSCWNLEDLEASSPEVPPGVAKRLELNSRAGPSSTLIHTTQRIPRILFAAAVALVPGVRRECGVVGREVTLDPEEHLATLVRPSREGLRTPAQTASPQR